eukprot:209624-Pyramimonas_sp.AAC.1
MPSAPQLTLGRPIPPVAIASIPLSQAVRQSGSQAVRQSGRQLGRQAGRQGGHDGGSTEAAAQRLV